MESESVSDAAVGSCLILLLQTSTTMSQPVADVSGDASTETRLQAAGRFVVDAIRVVLGQAAPEGGPLRVAVLGCGRTESAIVESLLPATTASAPWVELIPGVHSGLDDSAAAALATHSPTGDCATAEGISESIRLAMQWMAENPEGPAPTVVLCTDGALLDAVARARVGSLTALLRAMGGSKAMEWTANPTKDHATLLDTLAKRTSREAVAASRPPYPEFDLRAGWMTKVGNAESEWEDAFATDMPCGRLAVSDGAGSAIYSRLLAKLLTESAGAAPPILGETAAFFSWVDDCRTAWHRGIDYPNLKWSQQAKVDRVGGAATLLMLEFSIHPKGGIVWAALAVGDACLFWVRDNRLIASFPCIASQDFGKFPDLLSSRQAPTRSPLRAAGRALPGDLFVLATDAVSQWLLRCMENSGGVDWNALHETESDAWPIRFRELFDARQIENDDFTIVFARLR
jgi:hypothetical protein